MNVNELHQRAMDLADRGLAAAARGEAKQALKFYADAMRSERESALAARDQDPKSPSWYVLMRSAASLALMAKRNREGEVFVCEALSEDPPPEIAAELRIVWDELNYSRHVEDLGQVVSADSVGLSLSGGGIGPGLAPTEDVCRRMRFLSALGQRTADRLRGTTCGRSVSAETRRTVTPLAQPALVASYAFSVRFAVSGSRQSSRQDGRQIVREIVQGVRCVAEGDAAGLRRRIADAEYRRNFVALVRGLCPSGTVGQVAMVSSEGPPIRLEKVRADIFDEKPASDDGAEMLSIEGKLEVANVSGGEPRVTITDDNKKTTTLVVSKSIVDDVVREHWNTAVKVTAKKRSSRGWELVSIDAS